MMFLQFSLPIVFVILSCSALPHREKTKLLLVQTIFRHGDRAPLFLYPNDPNKASDWHNGMGRLTQLGKKQHYEVGKYIRNMYKDFVTSDPKEIYVNSSSADRCLESAESNLASFYAPTKVWRFETELNWEPIPVHYLPAKDNIYLGDQSFCPRSDVAFKKNLNSKEIQEFYRTHQTMAKEVTDNSGLNFSNPEEALLLFDTLEAERAHNLIIPNWAKKYWNELNELFKHFFVAFYDSITQLRLRTGPFLGLLTENLKKKMNGETPDLKFIINSSHDVKVAGILRAMNFTNISRPTYCATLLFELHQMEDSSFTVRMLYMNSTNPANHIDEPRILVLDGCSEYCPVEYFMESYKWLIPDNLEKECQVEK